MKLYRIIIENKNYNSVIALCSAAFPAGYTVLTGEGHYKGEAEHSVIIEIFSSSTTDVENLAYAIKKSNKQQAVLVQVLECEGKLI